MRRARWLAEHPEGESLLGALMWQVPFFAITVFGLLWWGKRKLQRANGG